MILKVVLHEDDTFTPTDEGGYYEARRIILRKDRVEIENDGEGANVITIAREETVAFYVLNKDGDTIDKFRRGYPRRPTAQADAPPGH